MMIAESMHLNPTAHISSWDSLAAGHVSPLDSITAAVMDSDSSHWDDHDEAYSSDRFRMYEFKVHTCARGRSHDWTKCPYAHAGEKARRRDPRKFNYSGAECPDSRNGCCKKMEGCELAHGTFEIWLHPDRYRTQPCRDGVSCRRLICFFAHTPEQLRIPAKHSSSRGKEVSATVSSPKSILFSPLLESPPTSPISGESSSRFVALMRKLQLEELKTSPVVSGFGSSLGGSDRWDVSYEEEPAMERVESGRSIRAQMYAKLMRDNFADRVRPLIFAGSRS